MKKIISVLLCITLLATASSTLVFADEEIEGLHEKLSALFLVNNFTEEQIADMDKQYVGDFNDRWEGILSGLKATGKMQTESDEDEYQYRLQEIALNYSSGIKVTLLKNTQYIYQYSQNNAFDYLFGNEYWSVFRDNGTSDSGRFSLSGQFLKHSDNYFGDYVGIILPLKAIEFVKDEDKLNDMLCEVNETKVTDMKIFAYAGAKLYIRCTRNSYIIDLYGPYNNLEDFRLYTVCQMAEDYENLAGEASTNYKTQFKPTYTAEAESLQADGLLYGNEKGLDLLKPLTRIEATTLLVRAMGYEDATTSETSYFADIASDNWGAKYANIACDKGIAEGVGDNRFAPDERITASQFATLILRNCGEDPDWQTAINTFVERGLITAEQAETMDLFTRGDMAKLIYEARAKNIL